MNFKKAYYYLFYKLFNFWEMVSTPKSWSNEKAVLSIIFLEFFLIQSIGLYYGAFIDKNSHFGKAVSDIVGMFLGVCVPNYFIFLYEDRWKVIVQEFDKWPAQKNKIGGLITWIAILAIIVQFFLLLFLLA